MKNLFVLPTDKPSRLYKESKQECMITKNSYPSSEFESKDRCPSCGNFCNIHTDLNDNDECNDCRDNIDNL